MKKITLLLCLFVLSMQAQDFPSPYCDVDDSGVTVEEITFVEFAEAEIENSDFSSVLTDYTSTEVDLIPGETYTLTVKGNTFGEFENNIVAFIDWNQNGILDDENEVYEMGTLFDSSGHDEISVSMEITVPEDAAAGSTRIRITKTYTDEESVAEVNPCAIEMDAFGMGAFPGFGQALDFTLNIGTMNVDSFDKDAFVFYPNPVENVLNIHYHSSIQSVKVFDLSGKEVYQQQFSDSGVELDLSYLPSGMYLVDLKTEQEGKHQFRILKK